MKLWNLWNQETREDTKPLKPRNLWNHEIKKPRNQETYESRKTMKLWNLWNQETHETTKPLK